MIYSVMGPKVEAEGLNVAMVGKNYAPMRVFWEEICENLDGGRVRIWYDWERFQWEWRNKVKINEFGLAVVDFTMADWETRKTIDYGEAARLMLLKSPKLVLLGEPRYDEQIWKVVDQFNPSQRVSLIMLGDLGNKGSLRELRRFVNK